MIIDYLIGDCMCSLTLPGWSNTKLQSLQQGVSQHTHARDPWKKNEDLGGVRWEIRGGGRKAASTDVVAQHNACLNTSMPRKCTADDEACGYYLSNLETGRAWVWLYCFIADGTDKGSDLKVIGKRHAWDLYDKMAREFVVSI